MIKITYTNGDVQNINVTGDFFTITLAPQNGKPVKLTPVQKAEAFAFDLADAKKTLVSSIDIYYKDQYTPKSKVFRPVDEFEKPEKSTPTPSYIAGLKEMKKEWRNKKPTNKWKWSF